MWKAAARVAVYKCEVCTHINQLVLSGASAHRWRKSSRTVRIKLVCITLSSPINGPKQPDI